MPQKRFKGKSKEINLHHSDLEEYKAEYSSQKSESDVSNCSLTVPKRVFVGGLSTNTDEWDIKAKFSRYGHVKFVKIIRDSMGTSKGYGFVTFATEEEAKNIMEKVHITIKGRKLNIAPAVRKQRSQSDSVSTEISSVDSLQEVPSLVCPQGISRYQSKTNLIRYIDNCRNTINWNMPSFFELTGYLGPVQLHASEDPCGNTQVNCMLTYPALIYIPQCLYQQTTGFSYANYATYPNLIPVIPAHFPSHSINAETI